MTLESGSPGMHFEKLGHTYQLRIRDADDLRAVLDLDDALWIATSAPVASLNTDAEFLDHLDTDDNGQIRTSEVRAAVRWLLEVLEDTSRIAQGTEEIALEAMDKTTPGGARLAETARYVLDFLGEAESESIGLGQVARFEDTLDSNPINGDGVIPPDAAEAEETAQFIRDVLACTEGSEDRTGRVGITDVDLETFLDNAAAYLKWVRRADPDSDDYDRLMPLGEETSDAADALEAVRQKVEDYFARCRAMEFADEGAGGQKAFSAAVLAEAEDAEAIREKLRRAPLADPNPEGILPLTGEDLNPAWADDVAAFRERAVAPVLGEREELTRDDWSEVKQFFAEHLAWRKSPEGARVTPVPRDRLAPYLDGRFPGEVRRMLAEDRQVADQLAAARELRKLLLYHKHLLPLANNFVSFPDLYDPRRRAMFEMGSLVIDGRWFNFAVRVEDRQEHREQARSSRMYVLYVELTRVGEPEKLLVAVPATSGTAGNLGVGKRGIFYGVDGRDYHARVAEIIENPISFREALISPFVRLGRFIVGKIEAISASAEKKLESRVGEAAQQVEKGIEQGPEQAAAGAQPQPVPASTSRRDILVGASVSIAALSSAFAFVTNQLSGLSAAQIGLAALGLAAVVLLPTAVVAFIKLRRRDLSAILEGCGWAINARMRLNRRQRKQFTCQQPYPAEATGTPRRRWLLAIMLVILLVVLAVIGLRALRRRRAGETPIPERSAPEQELREEPPESP